MFSILSNAYVGSSSSSYTIQFVAAGLIVAGIIIAFFWTKILSFIQTKRYEALEKKLAKEEQQGIKVAQDSIEKNI